MKRLIIHIGLPKCGTSALQNALAKSTDTLRRQNVVYPLSGRGKGATGQHFAQHRLLATLFDPRRAKGEQTISRLLPQFQKEVARYQTTVLSCERFAYNTDHTALREFLSGLDYESVEVMLYVREYLSFCLSSFSQQIKASGTFMPLAMFLHRRVVLAKLLERWQAIGDLKVTLYDKNALVDGNVVADFSRTTGIEVPSISDRIVNPTIGGTLLFAKLACNRDRTVLAKYATLLDVAERHKRFTGPFHVDAARAAAIRAASPFNDTLAEHVGEVPLQDFEACAHPVQPDRLEEDLALMEEAGIAELPRETIERAVPEARFWF